MSIFDPERYQYDPEMDLEIKWECPNCHWSYWTEPGLNEGMICTCGHKTEETACHRYSCE